MEVNTLAHNELLQYLLDFNMLLFIQENLKIAWAVQSHTRPKPKPCSQQPIVKASPASVITIAITRW